MGAPTWPPYPQTFDAPRQSRGASLQWLSVVRGPGMAPIPPTLGTPRRSRGAPRERSPLAAGTGMVGADPVGHCLALLRRQHVVHVREGLRDGVGDLPVLGLALRAER